MEYVAEPVDEPSSLDNGDGSVIRVEAQYPRQLIIYDEDSGAWKPTIDPEIIAHTKYLCVSYRQSDFPDASKLEETIQNICLESKHCDGLKAYWLDRACIGQSQEDMNVDLYRIGDVFKGAEKTLIMINDNDTKMQSPSWTSWGERLWTLPETLRSGYRTGKLLYKAGTRAVTETTLRRIANCAYKSSDEMGLMDTYSGQPEIAHDKMFDTLVRALWRRKSSRSGGVKEGSPFAGFIAEKVYVLMSFMAPNRRIIPNPSESEEEAFKRLMKENGLKKDLLVILHSSDEAYFAHSDVKREDSIDPEQLRVLGKAPNTCSRIKSLS